MINQELFLRFGAAISNTAAKGVLVFSLGSRSLRRYIWPAMIIMLTIGLAFAIFV